MSENLKEFTAEQMKGCPPFSNSDLLIGFEKVGGKYFEGQIKVSNPVGSEWVEKAKFNPIDRMNAICKHLFELMPDLLRIIISDSGETILIFETHIEELSINPFLFTDRTEITREELGL